MKKGVSLMAFNKAEERIIEVMLEIKKIYGETIFRDKKRLNSVMKDMMVGDVKYDECRGIIDALMHALDKQAFEKLVEHKDDPVKTQDYFVKELNVVYKDETAVFVVNAISVINGIKPIEKCRERTTKEVLSNSIPEKERDDASSAIEIRGNSVGNIANGGFVASQGDWIYYCKEYDEGLFKMRSDGSGKQKIGKDSASYINVKGDWLYFCNDADGGKLFRMRSDGSERKKLSNEKSIFATLVGDWIYYIAIGNQREDSGIIKVRVDGSGRKKLSGTICWGLCVSQNQIYYINMEDQDKLYCMSTEGNNVRKLDIILDVDNCCSYNVVNDFVFFTDAEKLCKMYKMQIDGKVRQIINEDYCSSINVVDSWVYYANEDDDKFIYKVRTDGSGRKKITDETCSRFFVAGDWIYYGSGEGVRRINIDGRNRQIIE